MERDESLKATAKRYADAQANLEQADRDASTAKTRAENARLERDRIEKEMRTFVGRNQPRRIVAVPDTNKVVLIDKNLSQEDQVFVTVETLS